jgi:uncharacterized membrane protein YccC
MHDGDQSLFIDSERLAMAVLYAMSLIAMISRLAESPVFFSLKIYLAAILALGIAFWQDLPFPYWAMMCVYILAQTQSGRLRLKGMHMVIGSLIGGTIGVAVATLFATSLTAVMVALSLALTAGMFLAVRHRRSNFYVFLLSGITCLLVAMPGVATPDTAFTRAIDRIEDVVVGVFSLILVDALLFPHNGLANTAAVTRKWLGSMREAVVGVLRGEPIDHGLQSAVVQQTLSLTPLGDGMACEGSSYGQERARALMSVVTCGIRLVPVLSSIGDFDRAFGRAAAHPEDVETRELLAQWIEAGCPDDARSAALRLRLRPRVATGASARAAATRLCYRRYLRGIYAGCRQMHHAFMQVGRASPERVHVPPGARMTPATFGHVDRLFALRGALCVALHMTLFGTLWSVTGWDATMAFGMLLSAIFVSISTLTSSPLPMLKGIAKVAGISMTIVAFYVLAVLPAVDSFVMLALALLPALFLLGFEVLKKGGVLFAVLPMAMLRIGSDGPGTTLDALLGSVIAMYLGIAVAVIANILIPNPSVVASVRWLVRASMRGLMRIRDRHGADARDHAWQALDRFMVIQTHLPSLESAIAEHPGMQTLRALRIGQSLGTLRRWAGSASDRRAAVKPLVGALRVNLARWTHKTGSALTSPLLRPLDAAFNHAAAAPASNAQALRALLEMRVALDCLASPRKAANEESRP